MDRDQATKRVSRLGYRYPHQVARVRVAIGVWLLVLAAVLYASGHGGLWASLLAVTATLHFCLAYRSVRIVRSGSDQGIGCQ
jgi:hypothetical protein